MKEKIGINIYKFFYFIFYNHILTYFFLYFYLLLDELFYKCGRATESKSTKRFNLSLTNGRNFCLQAETSMKCEEWILQLNKCGGRNMAVLRLQQCWRHYQYVPSSLRVCVVIIVF